MRKHDKECRWKISPVAIDGYRVVTGNGRGKDSIISKINRAIMTGERVLYDELTGRLELYSICNRTMTAVMRDNMVIDIYPNSKEVEKSRDMKGIGITKHAIARYKERRRVVDKPDDFVVGKILGIVERGTEVEPKNKAAALICHRFQEARYFQSGDLVAVVVDNTVVTVSKHLKNRWRVKSNG